MCACRSEPQTGLTADGLPTPRFAMPPTVSIIVPCYNEEGTIGSLLEAILAQTFPRQEMEVVIADGLSRDRTAEVISDFGKAHPDLALRLVENARRTIPSSLNLAIREARGEFLIRLDAHSIPIPEYVERCVAGLTDREGHERRRGVENPTGGTRMDREGHRGGGQPSLGGGRRPVPAGRAGGASRHRTFRRVHAAASRAGEGLRRNPADQ